jgi:hypothetical protein
MHGLTEPLLYVAYIFVYISIGSVLITNRLCAPLATKLIAVGVADLPESVHKNAAADWLMLASARTSCIRN